MRVSRFDIVPVSVPYLHDEVSSQVHRGGVTSALVRLETTDGLVGWGEACSGGSVATVAAALEAMRPFVVGCDPWLRAALRATVYHRGLWNFQAGTANFAFAGVDMALLDLCGRSVDQPLHRLFGGAVRDHINYFYYLARDTEESLREQCRKGRDAGYHVFYLKVGIDDIDDLSMVACVREAIGSEATLRVDANAAWGFSQARSMLQRLAEFDVNLVEQPIRENPVENLRELRMLSPIPISANEGMWSEAESFDRISARQADVYCFSPYWTGGIDSFCRLAHTAHMQGLEVCKHTHGELGIAASAFQQVLLTLPNVVAGNQQTATMLEHDVVLEPVPISWSPNWSVSDSPGIGVDVSDDAVSEATQRFERDGQYLPYGEASKIRPQGSFSSVGSRNDND